MIYEQQLQKAVNDAIGVISQLKEERHLLFIQECAKRIASAFISGGKVLIAGNGGSMCDAAHFAEELTGFFRKKRRALPALVLSEPAHISCTANDVGFDFIFSRGVEAFGKPGDIFIGLSTSGNSKNVLVAFEVAKLRGLTTIAFLGRDGGKMQGLADHEMVISAYPGSDRIQEAHMAALHIIIELVEARLYDEGFLHEHPFIAAPKDAHL